MVNNSSNNGYPLYSLLFAKIWVEKSDRTDMKINNFIHTLINIL